MNAELTVKRDKKYSLPDLIDKVETWDEGVALGLLFREERDRMSFALGALADKLCTGKVGRPSDDAEYKTITAFAEEIGEQREVISQLLANYRHYQHIDAELIPAELSWRQLSQARTRSGVRTGEIPTPEQIDNTVKFLNDYARKGRKAPPPNMWLYRLEQIELDIDKAIRHAPTDSAGRRLQKLREAVGELRG